MAPDPLFAPWRAEHVARAADAQRSGGDAGGPAGEMPVFSRIAGEPDSDRENLVVWRGRTCFAVLNRYPYTNGHLMVLPLREVAAYEDLTAEERHELADAAGFAMSWLRQALQPDGFNVGLNEGLAAGAGIPRHLHLHVVPRWSGDTGFMPVIADTKVIPEALDATWEKLRRVADGTEPA
jgi:ATP adenylyltransferase